MCWSETASVGMVALGAVATVVAARRRLPAAMTVTLGYFTVMEGLQAAGYAYVDQCGSPANQTLTLLSYLHIVFQPFFINAIALEFVPEAVRRRLRMPIFVVCALSAAVMLLQLYPFAWAGRCRPGETLCGDVLCLITGTWHIGWTIPYNDLLAPLEGLFGTRFSFPTYLITGFLIPFLAGSWRFVVMHALIGPILAGRLTANPNEWPAVWCLFSIGIVLVATVPSLRRLLVVADWPLWPASWRRAAPGAA